MALYNLDGVQQTVMAQRKTVDAQHLNDDDYNDYRRAEVARARQEIGVRKSQIPNLLLTLLGCVAILVILLREGMFGN